MQRDELLLWTNIALKIFAPHFLIKSDCLGILAECEEFVCLSWLHLDLDRLDLFINHIGYLHEPGNVELAASERIDTV